MQVPAHGRLWSHETICGQGIPQSADGVFGYFVRSLSVCQCALQALLWDSYGQGTDADEYMCGVAQRLIEERENPAHYGDNLPGWFDSNHQPLTPARFSFSDLIGYGPDPQTGGVQGFVAQCNAKSYEDLEIAAGLLSLDEAMQFAAVDLGYAFHLLGEAQELEGYVKLARLRRDLSAEVSEETLEKAFSQRQSERARARYEKDRDGKQAVKAEVKGWWEQWQRDPSLYRSAAAFARAMLDKYPDHLSSQPVIEQWVRDWKAEAEKP